MQTKWHEKGAVHEEVGDDGMEHTGYGCHPPKDV